jgi:hypothetical protein
MVTFDVPTPNPQSKKDTNVVKLKFICLLNLVGDMSNEHSVRTHFVNLSDKLSFVDYKSKRNNGILKLVPLKILFGGFKHD